MSLPDLAREFDRLHFETFKVRRRLFRGGGPITETNLLYKPTWQNIQNYLVTRNVSALIYFSALFDYRKSRNLPPAGVGVPWYGSKQAFEIFERHNTRIENNLGIHAHKNAVDQVIDNVNQGLRTVLLGAERYKDGLVARRLLAGSISPTFFAVDVYWPHVAGMVSEAVVNQVRAEQYRLSHTPSLLAAAEKAYYDWPKLAATLAG